MENLVSPAELSSSTPLRCLPWLRIQGTQASSGAHPPRPCTRCFHEWTFFMPVYANAQGWLAHVRTGRPHIMPRLSPLSIPDGSPDSWGKEG